MINLVSRFASTPTPPRAATPPAAPVARPIIEETVTLAGTALSTAAIGGLCAALAPVGGEGFHFAAQAVVGAVIAGVGGGAVGAWLVSKAANYGAKLGHVSHSQDEKIINPVMGFIAGGIAGHGSALAVSAFGAPVLGAALVCGGAVLAVGGLMVAASHLRKS